MKTKTLSDCNSSSAATEVLRFLLMRNQQLEAQLRDPARLAQALHHDVLANIGHELRTPLTIIQGLSEILLDESRGEDSQLGDFLRQIHRASINLGKLVETSIMLTKLNAGHLQLHPQPIGVVEAIERVVGQYQHELGAKRLSVELRVPEVPPVWVDGFCLELALQALLDNAIKFNVEGGRILWDTRYDQGRIRLSIQDTGVGIPPEKIGSLFAVFEQAETGSTRRFGGLGLGLPLVKKLVESMAGDIIAMSPGPNQGATFVLFLPASDPDLG